MSEIEADSVDERVLEFANTTLCAMASVTPLVCNGGQRDVRERLHSMMRNESLNPDGDPWPFT
jgi:hypothetical protein